MGFDIIRIGAYWNRIEKEEGIFDFNELDRQIAIMCGKALLNLSSRL
jgi:beta-galactosidase GanA